MPKTKSIHITDSFALKKRVEELKNRSDDIKSRVGPVLKQLWHTERALLSADPSININDLRIEFPQFKAVLDTIDDSLWIANLTKSHFSILPLLLNGEPGLGKTYFASKLAEALDLPYFEVSLATMSASFELVGASLQWAEGSTGSITKFLAESKVANPVILIDEVDKALSEAKYSTSNILYGLLEPHTAKRFKDEALQLEIDASHVNWILTSNYPERISAPLLSRMRIYEIQLPPAAEMKPVVQLMYQRYRVESGLEGYLDELLEEKVLNHLASSMPRDIRMQLQAAAVRAVKRGNRVIELNDLPKHREVNRVGFI